MVGHQCTWRAAQPPGLQIRDHKAGNEGGNFPKHKEKHSVQVQNPTQNYSPGCYQPGMEHQGGNPIERILEVLLFLHIQGIQELP